MILHPNGYRPSVAGVLTGNAFAAAVLLLFTLWHVGAPRAFHYHCQEDRLVEWLTAIFFLLASVGMAIAAWRHPAIRANKLRAVLPVCWILLLFVFAGEEVSWLQRQLGWGTSETWAALNKQGETNIHNIEWVDQFLGGKYRWLSILVLTSGFLLPLLAQVRAIRGIMNRVGLPVVPVHYVVFFLGGYVFGKLAHREIGNDAAEVREFVFSLGYLLFAIHASVVPESMMQSPEGPSDDGQRAQEHAKRSPQGQ